MISQYEQLKSIIFICNSTKARKPYPMRFHKDVELLYIRKGELEIQIESQRYLLKPGDLCVVFPNMLHSILSQDCLKYLVTVSPGLIPEFAKQLSSNKPLCPILRGADLPPIVEHLFSRCAELYAEQKYRTTLLCHVNSLLSEVLQTMTLQPRSSDPDLVQRIVEFVWERYTEDISLEQLAEALGYSKFHISRCINDTFGCNFRTLINNYRINAAEEMLLHSDKSITAIAYACGYRSQCSFNRAFLKYCGSSPAQYRKEN